MNAIELQRAKTHCPKGHPYDLLNTHFKRDGSRSCRECNHVRCTTDDKRAYYRAHARKRTPEYRKAQRERYRQKILAYRKAEAVAAGREYYPRGSRPPKALPRKPTKRFRWTQEAEYTVCALRLWGDSVLESPITTITWRVRYNYDAEFRAKEMARLYSRKTAALPDDGTLTGAVIRNLFAAAKSCPYCHHPMHSKDKSLDHLVPRSRGGWHGIDNVAVCCKRCNTRKHSATALEYVWFGSRGPHCVSKRGMRVTADGTHPVSENLIDEGSCAA